jgi:hypothetical protein
MNIDVFHMSMLRTPSTIRKLKSWVEITHIHENRKESTKFEQLHEKQKDSRIRTSCGDAA